MKRTVDEIVHEIDGVYVRDMPDYRGRMVNKEHALNYFWAGYYRFQDIVKYISRIGPGKKILDIGAGYGFYDIILKEDFGLDVTALELEENIPVYCQLLRSHGISIIPGELSKRNCPIPDENFDVVIFSEVIEHIRLSPLRALLEINRILKPSGLLLLTTPNVGRLSNVLMLLVGKNIVESFPDEDTGLVHITDKMKHIREYTMNELKVLMNRAGYKVIKAEYSICFDKFPPHYSLNWKGKLVLVMSMPILRFVPTLRSSIIILGQKVEFPRSGTSGNQGDRPLMNPSIVGETG